MASRNNVASMYLKYFKTEWFIIGFLNRVLFLSDVDTLAWNVFDSVYQRFEKQAVSPYYFECHSYSL